MKLYHFSDKYFDPDEYIPIGNFSNTISNGKQIVKEFEKLMEERRKIIDITKISRLNCLFTFSSKVAEGFLTRRKFLFELELPDDVEFTTHNHEIISYFERLFHLNDINYIKDELNLIDSYWLNNPPFKDSSGIEIQVGEEILVKRPLKVLKTILINELTKKEFIDWEFPLYHITPTRNIKEILGKGLENRNGKGICFVQKKHPLVLRYIIETMLINEGDEDFSVIEIIPKNFGIESYELLDDAVSEKTNSIHNYIKRDKIIITKSNIIKCCKANPLGIPNLIEYEEEMKRKGLLMPLNKKNDENRFVK